METRQQEHSNFLSVRAVPSIFWIIVVISACLALFLILLLVVLGYRDGLQRGAAQKRQQVAILLQRASDLLDDGRRQDALTAYRTILELDAQNEAARNAISTVMAMPTGEAVRTEEAAPNPLEIEWASILTWYEAGNWEETIGRMVQVRAVDADFRREELAEKLFSAYVELGRKKADDNSLEEAVQLFDKALELKPNDAEIQAERHMTASYVDVKTYWGADWTRVINLLEDLYRRDPEFRNVQYLLQRAHVAHGDSFAYEEEWCAATAEYTSAIAVLDWMELRVQREELAALCEEMLENRRQESGRPRGSPADAWMVGAEPALACAVCLA